RAMILESPVPGIIVDLMAMAGRPDFTNLLPTITCPTLIVVGEEDLPTPPAESSYMTERIPSAILSTIPQAGHLSRFEQPAEFNKVLQSMRTHRAGVVELQKKKEPVKKPDRFCHEIQKERSPKIIS